MRRRFAVMTAIAAAVTLLGTWTVIAQQADAGADARRTPTTPATTVATGGAFITTCHRDSCQGPISYHFKLLPPTETSGRAIVTVTFDYKTVGAHEKFSTELTLGGAHKPELGATRRLPASQRWTSTTSQIVIQRLVPGETIEAELSGAVTPTSGSTDAKRQIWARHTITRIDYL